MFISPNTTIRILRGVPLDPNYDNTIYFDNKEAQTQYFTGVPSYVLDQQSYQRVNSNTLRVNIQSEQLIGYNYLMFKNTSFGDKWFYCFIREVNYINNHVTEVVYEIDSMQTWFFDYELQDCFVEREHTLTDELFENIVLENIEIGDEYVANATDFYSMNNMEVCVLINRKNSYDQQQGAGSVPGREINGIYVPVKVAAGIPASDPASVDAYLDLYVEGDIVVIYQYPEQFYQGPTGDGGSAVTETKNITPNLSTIDGYEPKNKKLFCYPYNYLLVSNNSGQIAEYRWEDWVRYLEGGFKISGVMVSTPSVICYPRNYRGVVNAYDDGILYTNFPQCAWAGDTFKAWWAQNKSSFVTSGITSVLPSIVPSVASHASLNNFVYEGTRYSQSMGSTNVNPRPRLGASSVAALGAGVTVATGGTAGIAIAAGAGLYYIANRLAQINTIKHTPSQTYGQAQTESLNPGMGRVGFSFYSMSIKRQYAEIVDDYFTHYGYAILKNKKPNRNARPYWTYTKTLGCNIKGIPASTVSGGKYFIPSDEIQKICSIYDHGITFWTSADYIGDYNLDNRPQS